MHTYHDFIGQGYTRGNHTGMFSTGIYNILCVLLYHCIFHYFFYLAHGLQKIQRWELPAIESTSSLQLALMQAIATSHMPVSANTL